MDVERKFARALAKAKWHTYRDDESGRVVTNAFAHEIQKLEKEYPGIHFVRMFSSVDYTKARQSYEKAAARGDEEAKRGLSRLSQSFGTPFVRPSQR